MTLKLRCYFHCGEGTDRWPPPRDTCTPTRSEQLIRATVEKESVIVCGTCAKLTRIEPGCLSSSSSLSLLPPNQPHCDEWPSRAINTEIVPQKVLLHPPTTGDAINSYRGFIDPLFWGMNGKRTQIFSGGKDSVNQRFRRNPIETPRIPRDQQQLVNNGEIVDHTNGLFSSSE